MGETVTPTIRDIEWGIQEERFLGAETEEKSKQQQEPMLRRKLELNQQILRGTMKTNLSVKPPGEPNHESEPLPHIL